jgi:hypothetical protein
MDSILVQYRHLFAISNKGGYMSTEATIVFEVVTSV